MENNTQISDQYDDEIDLRELFSVLWAGKTKIIAVTAVFAVASVIYALSVPNQYKATALLAPAQSDGGGLSGALGQLGGLASLAGVSIGGGESSQSQIAQEIMKSWSFVVCFVDTPGAYPGLEAEERGQGEAIARNIIEMTRLKVPIIVVIIGEGASGGALGIGVGDRVLMLENTWYSVISPESCCSILWRSWEYKEQAAEALKLTANDMKRQNLIDLIVKEPLGGAHNNKEKTFEIVSNAIVKEYKTLMNLSPKELVKIRMKKYSEMGVFNA